MNKYQQKAHIKAYTKEMIDVIVSKAGDYANYDVLSNFKLVSQIVGITPQQVLMVFIATKAVRLGNLIGSNKTPNNESISDSLLDLSNYSALMDMALSEAKIAKNERLEPEPDAYCETYCSKARECDRTSCDSTSHS